ncbi:MAG TPA: PrsW family intramembrane metalloprotease [bacterium]|nr:PrsW family intramembrane metalloprotease [bacterium]
MEPQPGGVPIRPGGALKGAWIATSSQLLPFLRITRHALAQRAALLPIAVLLVVSSEMLLALQTGRVLVFQALAVCLLAGAALLYRYYRARGQTALLGPIWLLAAGLVAMLVLPADQGAPLAGIALTLAIFLFIYRLAGKPKPLWLLAAVALAVGWVISSPWDPVAPLELMVVSRDCNSFACSAWIGVVEETFKILPVVILYFVGRRLHSPEREAVGIWEPLDGVIMACASATGFAFAETLGYASHFQTAALLVARPLSSIAGHLAYSGFLGYAVGLAALKPASALRALTIGFVIAVGLHAVWDTLPASAVVTPIVAIVAYAVLASAILKARDISPARAQLWGSVWLGTAATPAAVTPEPRPSLPPGLYLRVGNRHVAVAKDLQLREHDIGGSGGQTNSVVADVTVSPRDPAVLGLRNLSATTWIATPLGSGSVEIAHGRSIRLQPGTTIVFGTTSAEVERI